MTTDEFWGVVDSVTAAQSMDSKCSLLRDALTELSDDELSGFVEQFDCVDVSLYTWPLWGAAYVIGGGCGDDSFTDFRASLIARGRNVVESAAADPDALAELELSPDELFYEGFQYVALEVAEGRQLELSQSRARLPDDPVGEEWDENDLPELFPALWRRFGTSSTDDETEIDETEAKVETESSPPRSRPWWRFWKS